MPFVDDKGLLNEFAMMYALRERFPLHYVVFRQTSSHLPHEANVEQVFSRAGLLSDPNLDPAYLAILVKVGFNKKAYQPSVKVIMDKYYEMFRGKSGTDDEEMESASPAAAGSSSDAVE